MLAIADSGDFNYLQLLVFDWREQKQAVSVKRAKWGIFTGITWAIALILFCIMKWWNESQGYPAVSLSIFLFWSVACISVTGMRIHYTKAYKRYEVLITEARDLIKEL